jgi:rhamnosyltransferase
VTALPSVTVTVLSYNGEAYLDAILTAVEAQRYDGNVETLVIDSGSTDGTLQIVQRHPHVRLHQIPNSEFGHGRTRNLAASLATGEIVVYLTHDAVPANRDWLARLVAPIVDDQRIVAVLGKQVARPSAPPLLKYDIARVFARLGPDHGVTVAFDDGTLEDEHAMRLASFYSDTCSAARRELLLNKVPYRDVEYAEDQVFGRDLIEGGYRKAYAPGAIVEHSNDGNLREFGKRIAADLIGLRGTGVEIAEVSRFAALKQWVKWSAMDAAQILVDRDYSLGRKLYWLLMNPLYHAVKWSNYRRASHYAVAGAPITR